MTRRFNGVFTTGIFVVLAFVNAGDVSRSRDNHVTARHGPGTSFRAEAESSRRTISQALHLFVADDSQGREIAAWHDRKTVYYVAETGGDRIWSAYTKSGDDWRIKIILIDEAGLIARGVAYSSPTQYSTVTRQMFLPPLQQYTDAWRSALLAHELVHAMEHEQGIISFFDPRSATSQDPEIRAYELEFRLLDIHVQGRWKAEMDRILDERGLLVAPVAGAPLERVRPTQDDISRLTSFWPAPQSEGEIQTRTIASQYALNFRFADRFGLGIEWKREYLLQINALIEQRQQAVQ